MSEGMTPTRGRIATAGAFLALIAALWVSAAPAPASHEGPPIDPQGYWDGGFGPVNEHEVQVKGNDDGTFTGRISKAASSGCTSFALESSSFSYAVAAGPKGEVIWKLTNRTDNTSFTGEVLVDPKCTNGASAREYWPATFDVDDVDNTMRVTATNPDGVGGEPDEVSELYSNPNLGDTGLDKGTKGAVKPTKGKVGRKGTVKVKVKAKKPTAFGSYDYRIYAVVKQKKKCNSRFVFGLFGPGRGSTKTVKIAAKKGRELKKGASGNEKSLKKPPNTGLDQSAIGKKRKKWCKGKMHIMVREFFTPAGETNATTISVLGRAKVTVKG